MFVRSMGLILFFLAPFVVNAAIPTCQVIEKNNIKTLPLEEITGFIQFFIFEQSGVPGFMLGIISGDENAVISCGETAKANGQRPTMNTIRL